MSTTDRPWRLAAAVIGLGLLAGCAHRTTTVRERETITTEPRVREERTVIVPEPMHEETTVIKKRREILEEEDD